MATYNFNQAMYQANILYGTNFTNADDFAEIALIGWEAIGNKKTRLYKFVGHPDEQGIVQLPCNCEEGCIEAVVAPHEDWNYTSNIHNYGDLRSEWIEEWIEHWKFERHPLYASGHYVHYKQFGTQLQILEPVHVVLVIYKGIILDEEGLPELNEKEMKAIATYVAYVTQFKEAIQTKNQAAMQFAQKLEQMWNAQLDNARTPAGQLSQNDFDNIANAKSRWPGKVYGKSYKPLMK